MSCAIFELLHLNINWTLDSEILHKPYGSPVATPGLPMPLGWSPASPGWRFDKGPGHPIT